MADTIYCSFCGKSQHEVRKMVAAPKAFICDGCILLCLDVIMDRPAAQVKPFPQGEIVEQIICSSAS